MVDEINAAEAAPEVAPAQQTQQAGIDAGSEGAPNSAPDSAPQNIAGTTEGAPASEAPEQESADEKPKRKSKPFRQRLGEVSEKKRLAEAEAAEAHAEAEYWRAKASKSPREEDFDNSDAFWRAQASFTASLSNAEKESRRAERAQDAAKTIAEQITRETQQSWQRQITEFERGTPDFREVAYSAPISESVSLLIAQMDDGAAVAYHLGKNPDIAQDISALSPQAAAMQLGRLSAEVSRPAPKASKAPPPVSTVGGPSGGSKNPETMTYAEWRKFRGFQG